MIESRYDYPTYLSVKDVGILAVFDEEFPKRFSGDIVYRCWLLHVLILRKGTFTCVKDSPWTTRVNNMKQMCFILICILILLPCVNHCKILS